MFGGEINYCSHLPHSRWLTLSSAVLYKKRGNNGGVGSRIVTIICHGDSFVGLRPRIA